MTRTLTYHTIESLMALTAVVGDCQEWQRYCTNDVPQVFHGGRMVSVRRLILSLQGATFRKGDHASCSCGNKLCVAPAHIIHRNKAQHARAMSKAPARSEVRRSAKLAEHARAHRAKITMEIAMEIRCSSDSGPVLAERFGVHRSLISRIRRGKMWRDFSSPFAGLGARGA